jgi:hypothetical protein
MAATTDPRSVGQRFLTAFATRDYTQVEACFHPQAQFRALIPPGLQEAADAAGATGHLRSWFGDADRFEMVDPMVEPVSDLLHIAYRLRVHDADGWQLFEQQAYCHTDDGRIEAMDLLCSGPRPDPVTAPGGAHT